MSLPLMVFHAHQRAYIIPFMLSRLSVSLQSYLLFLLLYPRSISEPCGKHLYGVLDFWEFSLESSSHVEYGLEAKFTWAGTPVTPLTYCMVSSSSFTLRAQFLHMSSMVKWNSLYHIEMLWGFNKVMNEKSFFHIGNI